MLPGSLHAFLLCGTIGTTIVFLADLNIYFSSNWMVACDPGVTSAGKGIAGVCMEPSVGV